MPFIEAIQAVIDENPGYRFSKVFKLYVGRDTPGTTNVFIACIGC